MDVSFTGGGSFTSTGPVHTCMSSSHVEDPVTRRDPVHRLVLAVRGPPRVILPPRVTRPSDVNGASICKLIIYGFRPKVSGPVHMYEVPFTSKRFR